MTAFTTYADGATASASAGNNAAGAPMRTVIVGYLDAARRNLAAADSMVVIDIPANTFVEQVFIDVETVDASQTVSIGDADAADGWLVGASVATAGVVEDSDSVNNAADGKLYKSGGTIIATVPATKALDTAKFRVICLATLLG